MKIKKDTELFRVLTGSHLYGTANEASDRDYKAVCLPSLDDLLLNKRLVNKKELPAGHAAGDKMLPGEVETEYLPLQVFFNDFFNGQTYAIEIAFATAAGLHEASSLYWESMMRLARTMVETFLSNDIKKMVGYAIGQSRLYGLKTQRYTSMKNFVETVEEHFISLFGQIEAEKFMRAQKLWQNPTLLDKVLSLEHIKECTIANAHGGASEAAGLEACGKKFPVTNTWATVVASMKSSLNNYGHRVKQFDGEGVDWKALSHAIRVTEQALELSRTGMLIFPRPNAQFLLAVKNGKFSLDAATNYLEKIFSEIDDAVVNSVLPEKTEKLTREFEQWQLNRLRDFYYL